MYTDKLIELIENSQLPNMQKSMLNGFVARAIEEQNTRQADYKLVEEFGREKYIDTIVLSTDEVKIYKVCANPKDEWTVKFPYHFIYVDAKKVNWTRGSTVCPSLDTAYLAYLGAKQLGANNQFSDFAMKMLDIKVEE